MGCMRSGASLSTACSDRRCCSKGVGDTMTSDNAQYYGGEDLEAMGCAVHYHQWVLSEIRPYLGESVAEVGAGCGGFSRFLLKTSIKSLHAFEPAANMFEQLVRAVGADLRVNAIQGGLDKCGDESAYDSVVYINVLEHVKDDALELEIAWNALKPQGHLILFVPALPWLYSDFDRQVGHYRRYMKRELEQLVRRAGFTLVKGKYIDFPGVFSWYIQFVLRKKTLSRKTVERYDRFVIPLIRRVEGFLQPMVGKNILIVARKNCDQTDRPSC